MLLHKALSPVGKMTWCHTDGGEHQQKQLPGYTEEGLLDLGYQVRLLGGSNPRE